MIITPDFAEVVAVGYNGPSRGQDNGSCRNLPGACGCIHAEANAIARLASVRTDLVLITTLAPCEQCAGLIVNCGKINLVIWSERYRDDAWMGVLAPAGVKGRQYDIATER